jgi:hypothetical protein
MIDEKRGHNTLAVYFREEEWQGRPSQYGVIHLPYHLAHVKRWDEVWQLYDRNYDEMLKHWIFEASDVGLLCLEGLIDHFEGTGRAGLLLSQLARIYLHRNRHDLAHVEMIF